MEVVVGGIYHHFKGHNYRVLALAKHSETLEKMVVYQNIEDSTKIWVRPYSLFVEKVNHQQYPEVQQKMRFERVLE